MKSPGAWPFGRAARGLPATLAACALLLVTFEAKSEPRGSPAQAGPVIRARLLAEDELRRARELEARGDFTLALSAYTAALRTDTTLGQAYLGLARLRERLRDFREAELLYTHALFVRDVRGAALLGRALLRRAGGREREAFLDLEQSVELEPDPRALSTLAAWYAESRNWPAALAVWRRLANLHVESGDAASLRDARLSIAALSLLAADADPVAAVPEGANWVRRALAHIACRSHDPRERR